VLLGPLVPELQARWGATLPEIGRLFVAQFAVSALGAWLAARHLRRSLVWGQALLAAGLAVLAGGAWPAPYLAMSLVGAGLGLAIPGTNLLVARANPTRRGAALSTVNLIWGFGAVACPLVFAALRGRGAATAAVWALAGLCALTSVLLALVLPAEPAGAAVAEAAGGAVRRRLAALRWLIAGMLFLYIGVESTVGGWLVKLADLVGEERDALSMLIGSGFWAALLAGRAGAPLLLRRVAEGRLHAAAVGVAAAGALAILAAGSRGGIAVGAVVTGLGLAPLFPLTVSRLAADGGGTRGTGWVFSIASCGGAALPWLTGRLTTAGTLHDGFVVPVAGLGLMAVLLAAHRVLAAPGAPSLTVAPALAAPAPGADEC
jgi:fucose permease